MGFYNHKEYYYYYLKLYIVEIAVKRYYKHVCYFCDKQILNLSTYHGLRLKIKGISYNRYIYNVCRMKNTVYFCSCQYQGDRAWRCRVK